MIWEGYLAIDKGMRKIWIPWWNLIFNFRGQNISLEQSRLTSQCFPIINVSDYTCLIIGNVDHINSYFLLTNLTTIGVFEWGQTIKGFIEEPTRCNNNNLLISKISSTYFGQSFVHLHERKTEIFTEYGVVSCCGRQGFGERQRGTTCTVWRKFLRTVHVVPRCRSPNPCLPQQQDSIPYSVKISVLRSWRWTKDCPKHVELILEINKLLLLHLVGSSMLLYLHCWCTVKHKSNKKFPRHPKRELRIMGTGLI